MVDQAPENYRVQTTAYQQSTKLFDDKAKGDAAGPPKRRAESLATRGDVDFMSLINDAKEKCRLPIKLSFENICFDVQILNPAAEVAKTGEKYSRRLIVDHATGVALPGQTTFIMGASGAGKTSLLNILADRVPVPPNGMLSGNILFNDEIPVNKHTFAKYAAYVQQEDILFARFTVREALTFAARLKLTVSKEEQDRRVEELIHDLGLQYCAHKEIGSVFHRILNFSERKRTSIGLELISDPSVIMLDEPTSGMDSFRAKEIVSLMYDLARKKGKTVCSTIH